MTLALGRVLVPADWARHRTTSDRGGLGALLAAVPPRVEDTGLVDRNLIVHYRAHAAELPDDSRGTAPAPGSTLALE